MIESGDLRAVFNTASFNKSLERYGSFELGFKDQEAFGLIIELYEEFKFGNC